MKDGFLDGEFPDEWQWLRTPYAGTDGATLVFYPHGNLALASDMFGAERKITLDPYESSPLLEVIAGRWRDDEMIPIFVSEGKSEQKRQTISRSRYLKIVYREVLPESGPNIVTYGWSFGEEDRHIIKQLLDPRNEPGVERVAVSVLREKKPRHVAESECAQIKKEILQVNRSIEVDFYDSASRGCWVH